MAYTPGTLFAAQAPADLRAQLYLDEDEEPILEDHRTPFVETPPAHTYPVVYLPHSCGCWVVGGPDNIRALIHDLQAVLATAGETG